jgi:DNA-binding NtrC family response regulator
MTASKHMLVLLVDDEPSVRMIACDGLEDAGFDVVEASNAQEAMTILMCRSDVGVLFTDVDMPGEFDGLDLADLVHDRWPAIKLVVTSGRSLIRAVPLNGHFLAKPYSLRAMTDLIDEPAGKP